MKRLLTVGLLLLTFGCVNPDPPPDPPSDPPQLFFGYLGTAMQGCGTGNYIAELSTSSNIATISSEDPEDTDYIIDLILEAQDYGMQSVVWVDHLFFHIENWGTPEQELYLYPDWQERWDRYASGIAPYMDSVLMFYILDEPFWNGLKVGIPQPEMLVMIETVAATIKNTFPDVHVGSCFAQPSVNRSLIIPTNYTMVGFCWYYQRGQNVETYIEMYLAYLDVFRSAMHPHQKLFLVPGAYQNANNIPSQNDLILTSDFFYNLFLSERAEMMIAFLYPSVPPGLIGLEALPELMAKWEEIGNLIINPDETVELKESKEKTANYVQRKAENTLSIEEEEFHDLYDQAIDMLVIPGIDLGNDDLYEQANELVIQAQIIADELFCGETERAQRLITILTKDYGELYLSTKFGR